LKRFLVISAAAELGVGLGLVLVPATVAQLLLGATLDAPVALTVARVAGAALVALGLACWRARDDGRVLVLPMLFYNLAAVAVLAYAAIGLALSGIGLWPAVALHTALAGWCVIALK
jgi:hypothetical protein